MTLMLIGAAILGVTLIFGVLWQNRKAKSPSDSSNDTGLITMPGQPGYTRDSVHAYRRTAAPARKRSTRPGYLADI